MSGLEEYRTRSTRVAAIQYDGANLERINALLRAAGHPPVTDLLEVGAWVVFAGTRFQILPNAAFQRTYEPADVETVVEDLSGAQLVLPIPGAEFPRTCFRCTSYAMTNDSVGFCTLFNETVDSELYAAADCSGFDPEGL